MIVDKEAPVPNSFSLSSRASFVVRVKSKREVKEANLLAKKEGLPLLALGDGTNILPSDYIKAVVALLEIKGKDFGKYLKVEAGENWDDVVKFSVQKGFRGIEALSGIPGKVGAAPIQNIGAYGSEISDSIEKVEVYDREKNEFIFLNKKECQFGYRDSIFKRHREKFIISSIILKLQSSYDLSRRSSAKEDRKRVVKIPDYRDVRKYFEEKENITPTLLEIREAIIEIRKNKLPDPKIVPNCGSFFKNVFVLKSLALKMKKKFPSLPTFESGDLIKIPAGFLIEQAGFKGKKIGKIEVYKNNALVLTNPNGASFTNLISAKNKIQESVFKKFGITLEPEVNIIK